MMPIVLIVIAVLGACWTVIDGFTSGNWVRMLIEVIITVGIAVYALSLVL